MNQRCESQKTKSDKRSKIRARAAPSLGPRHTSGGEDEEEDESFSDDSGEDESDLPRKRGARLMNDIKRGARGLKSSSQDFFEDVDNEEEEDSPTTDESPLTTRLDDARGAHHNNGDGAKDATSSAPRTRASPQHRPLKSGAGPNAKSGRQEQTHPHRRQCRNQLRRKSARNALRAMSQHRRRRCRFLREGGRPSKRWHGPPRTRVGLLWGAGRDTSCRGTATPHRHHRARRPTRDRCARRRGQTHWRNGSTNKMRPGPETRPTD